MRALTAFLVASLLPLATLAQESPGQGGQPEKGTVVKGKAPVAKEILKVKFPKPKSFKLSNGVTVYLLEDHKLPAVRFSLIMHAGRLYETKPGVAGMTASMMNEGTATHDYVQLAEQTESIGANVNVMAGTDTATLNVSGLSELTDTLIGIMTDVLLHPSFPNDRLDRLKYNRTSSMSQRRSNPGAMLGDVSLKVFYGGTKYGRRTPNKEEVNAIAREDLVAFHDAFYRPNGALLGVSGDIDAKTLKRKMETAFADWKPGTQNVELPKADFKAKDATRIYLVDRPNSAQSVLQFGNIAVARNDPDYIPLVVANRILGGGSAGRLFQNIRERRGYTYGAYSSLNAGLWPGIWGASASVRTAVTAPAVHEFFVEFNRLQDDLVPPEELALAKRSLVGGFALSSESPEAGLRRTLELVQNGLPMNYWDTYPAKVQAVTAEDVQRVARKYLGKDRMQVMVVGERKQIEEGLRQFGPIEVVDPSTIGGGEGDGPPGRGG